MRFQKQLHDEEGKFVNLPFEGVIPDNWTEVTAHFLDDEEKQLLGYLTDMNASAPDLIDNAFANAVDLLTKQRQARIEALAKLEGASNRNG